MNASIRPTVQQIPPRSRLQISEGMFVLRCNTGISVAGKARPGEQINFHTDPVPEDSEFCSWEGALRQQVGL